MKFFKLLAASLFLAFVSTGVAADNGQSPDGHYIIDDATGERVQISQRTYTLISLARFMSFDGEYEIVCPGDYLSAEPVGLVASSTIRKSIAVFFVTEENLILLDRISVDGDDSDVRTQAQAACAPGGALERFAARVTNIHNTKP